MAANAQRLRRRCGTPSYASQRTMLSTNSSNGSSARLLYAPGVSLDDARQPCKDWLGIVPRAATKALLSRFIWGMPIDGIMTNNDKCCSRSALGRHHAVVQFIRFWVGIFNTIVGYLVFFGAYLALGDHRIAIVTTTAVRATFNYFLYRQIGIRQPRYQRIPAHSLIGGVNILVVDFLIRIGASPAVAQLLTLPRIVVLSS